MINRAFGLQLWKCIYSHSRDTTFPLCPFLVLLARLLCCYFFPSCKRQPHLCGTRRNQQENAIRYRNLYLEHQPSRGNVVPTASCLLRLGAHQYRRHTNLHVKDVRRLRR